NGKSVLPWEQTTPLPTLGEFYNFLCTSTLPDERFTKLKMQFFGGKSKIAIGNVEDCKIKFQNLENTQKIFNKELASAKLEKSEYSALKEESRNIKIEIKNSKKPTKEFNKSQSENAFNSINKKLIDLNRKLNGHEKLRQLIIAHYHVDENKLREISKMWEEERMPLTPQDIAKFLKSEPFLKIDPVAQELLAKFPLFKSPRGIRNLLNFEYKIQEVNQVYDLPWEKFVLPTAEDLRNYVRECTMDVIEEKTKLSPAIICKRIMNYTKMITSAICKTQEDFYTLNAILRNEKLTIEEQNELESKFKVLKEKMRNQMDLVPAKADDCAIIVIRPGNK
ncbi:MAG: hypothetical protein JSR46_07720, partial [Verrucomicrobia bacterium]|nr:hypothetical protein [Verrucomicrobiota bacterium]